MKNLMNYIGVEKDRVNFAWVSASEGGRFAELVNELTDKVKKLGPNKSIMNKRCEV